MFRDRIRDSYERLSPGFRRLADFIVNNTLDAAFLTATELARRVEVDPATVVRFAQDLGYTGYRELSQEIKRHVHDRITTNGELTDHPTTRGQRLAAQLEGLRQQLQQLTMVDFDRLGEIATVIDEASAIWVVAEGSLALLAQAFAQSLQDAGLSVTAFRPDLLETAMRLSHMNPGDALLTLGSEGTQIDIGHLTHLAREKGVHTLSISSNGLQLAAQEAELALLIPHTTTTIATGYSLIGMLLSIIVEDLRDQRQEFVRQLQKEQLVHLARLMELRRQNPGQSNEAIVIWSRQLGWDERTHPIQQ